MELEELKRCTAKPNNDFCATEFLKVRACNHKGFNANKNDFSVSGTTYNTDTTVSYKAPTFSATGVRAYLDEVKARYAAQIKEFKEGAFVPTFRAI